MRQQREDALELVGPRNFAIEKAGNEKYGHGIRAKLALDDNNIALVIDVKNAFNSLPRHLVRLAASKLGHIDTFLDYMDSSPVTITFADRRTGFSRSLTLGEGTIQGGPEGSTLYAIAQRAIYDQLSARFPLVCARSTHDDTTLVGRPAHVFEAFQWLKDNIFTQLHLSLSVEKCVAYVPDLSAHPDPNVREAYVARASTTTELAAQAGTSVTLDGIVVAGIPIGTDSFITDHVKKAADKALLTATKAISLHHKALGKRMQMTLARIFTLIRLCIPSQLTYLLRTCPPSLTRPVAQRFDTDLYGLLATLFHWPPLESDDPTAKATAQRIMATLYLPISMGGLGMDSTYRAADNAYIASIAATGPAIVQTTNSEADIENLAAHIPELAAAFAHAKALGTINLQSVEGPADLLKGPPIERGQGALTRAAHKQHLTNKVTPHYVTTQSRAIFEGGKYTGQFLSTIYSDMGDPDFAAAIANRTATPLSPATGNCRHPHCNKLLTSPDQVFNHAFTCCSTAPNRTHRHSAIVSVVAATARTAARHAEAHGLPLGVHVEGVLLNNGFVPKDEFAAAIANNQATEQRIPVRADLILQRPNDSIIVDVTVVHPTTYGGVPDVVGTAAARASALKVSRYTKHWLLNGPDTVLGLGFETSGLLHRPDYIRLHNILAEAYGIDLSNPHADIPHAYTQLMSNLKKRLSIAVHTHNARLQRIYSRNFAPRPAPPGGVPAPE